MAGENPQTTLPPVPREPLIGSNGRMSSQWERWIQQIQRVLSFSGGIAWQIINKAGAKLSDLPERTHAMLQSVLGWSSSADTAQNKHISDANGKKWEDHVNITDGNPHGTDHSMLDAVQVLDPASSDATKDKHLSNAQGKVWQDHVGLTNSNPHGTDHDMLDGLADDDHAQYLLLAGRPSQRAVTPLIFGTPTDNTTIEADGTVVFNGAATMWDDLATTMSSARVSGASLTATSAGFYDYRFNTGNSVEFPAQELSHGYAEGTQIEFHIHFIVDDATPDTTDRYVKWQIDYWYVPRGSRTAPFPVYTATQTVSTEIKIPANTPAMSEITDSIGTFTNINMKQAGRIKMKVTRIAATGTAPSNSPFLSQVGIHIERARVGSRTMTAA